MSETTSKLRSNLEQKASQKLKRHSDFPFMTDDERSQKFRYFVVLEMVEQIAKIKKEMSEVKKILNTLVANRSSSEK